MAAISGVSSHATQATAEVQQQQQVQAAKKVAPPGGADDGSKDAKATVQTNVTGLNKVV